MRRRHSSLPRPHLPVGMGVARRNGCGASDEGTGMGLAEEQRRRHYGCGGGGGRRRSDEQGDGGAATSKGTRSQGGASAWGGGGQGPGEEGESVGEADSPIIRMETSASDGRG